MGLRNGVQAFVTKLDVGIIRLLAILLNQTRGLHALNADIMEMGENYVSKSIFKSFYTFYFSNIYLLTYVVNRKVKNILLAKKLFK